MLHVRMLQAHLLLLRVPVLHVLSVLLRQLEPVRMLGLLVITQLNSNRNNSGGFCRPTYFLLK